MDMKERFNKAFAYLRGEQIINGQKDLAEKLGATPSNISKALSGDKSALTNNLMKRFSAAFPGVFNLRWLILGEGEMLQSSQKPQEAHVISEVNNSTPETLSELVGQITRLLNKIDEKDAKIEELMKENNELREELNGGYLSKKRS